jgi:hypothetical protein
MRRSHSGFGSWGGIRAATDELKAGAASHGSSTDDAGPAPEKGGLDAVMPSRNCPTRNERLHVLQPGRHHSFRVAPTFARIYALIRDTVLGFDWSWSTDRAILVFHWLFTLKLLVINGLGLIRPDAIDVVMFALSASAVASLLLNSRLMNAVFLTAVTFLKLWMTFPFSINHLFLEFYVALLLLVLNTRWGNGEDDYSIITKLFLSVWWIAAIQKLVNGRFLNGESFMVAWDTDNRSDLGDALENVRAMAPNIDAWHLFVGLAIIIFLTELLLPLGITFNPQKRFLWYGMFLMQFGVWQATGELSFALSGFALSFLGLTGPNVPLRCCSPVPKAILIVLILWPFLHMGLASVYGFSPWRLGGWGMYSTPHFLSEYRLEFNAGEQRSYSFREIPWPTDQYRDHKKDCDLCIEFNSSRALERLEEAFRNTLAAKYRADAEVIRARKTKGRQND